MSQLLDRGFYVYAYLRARHSRFGPVGSFYYIGKGKGRRAKNRLGRITMPQRDTMNIAILADKMTERDALQAEMFLIHFYGRIDKGNGCLRNRTDGGIGSRGLIWTESQLEKLKGRVRAGRTAESKLRTSLALMGHPVSEETRMRQKAKKQFISDETRKKMRDSHLGKTASAETRQRMRESQLQRFSTKKEGVYA